MPLYSWILLIVILSVNHLAYFDSRLITSGLTHHSIALSLDEKLPFVPVFIIFYVLAYVQWTIGFVVIARGEKDIVFKVFIGELIAKFIAFLCFVIYPTTMEGLRPSVETLQGRGFLCSLTALVYSLDTPDNLFPSIHCLESWVCLRGALMIKKLPAWYKVSMLVMTLLVFASTVLVRQHVLLDIAGGVAAFEAGLFISRRIVEKAGKVRTAGT